MNAEQSDTQDFLSPVVIYNQLANMMNQDCCRVLESAMSNHTNDCKAYIWVDGWIGMKGWLSMGMDG